jgi:hypothetical protein
MSPQIGAYDTQCSQWIKLNPMQLPIHGMEAALVEDAIILISRGGIVEGGVEPVEVLDFFGL